MNEKGYYHAKLPLKSVAAALLFSAILGPLGLLYASTFGGCVMLFLFFCAISSGKYFVAAAVFWIVSCIWSVAATNHYNKKVLISD